MRVLPSAPDRECLLYRVNDAACKRLGASGVVKLNKQTIQVIVGAKAESVAMK